MSTPAEAEDHHEERSDRRRSFYTPEERKFIDPFKDEYLKATTPHHRRHVAITQIFVPLFNHWRINGKQTNKEEGCADLLFWIRNNWRLPTVDKAPPLAVKRTDVLWNNHRNEVFVEIASLLGVPTADTKTEGWFGKLSTALGNILARKSQEELIQLDLEIAEIAEKGYPLDKKVKYAEKYAVKRFDKLSIEHYKEMGLLTISFVTRPTDDGALEVELHDRIGHHLGIPSSSFEALNKGPVLHMKKLLFDYINSLTDALTTNRLKGPGVSADAALAAPVLELTTAGYPKLLPNFDPEQLQKRPLENHLRTYIGNNYLLATGGRTHQPPYAKLKANISSFIDSEYLPAGIQLKDPRNMVKPHIVAFFKHIQQREQSYDIADVFRFHQVQGPKTSDELVKSQYPGEEGEVAPKPKKKYRRKSTQNDAEHAKRQREMENVMQLPDDFPGTVSHVGFQAPGSGINVGNEQESAGTGVNIQPSHLNENISSSTKHYPTPERSPEPPPMPGQQLPVIPASSLRPPPVIDPALQGLRHIPNSPSPASSVPPNNQSSEMKAVPPPNQQDITENTEPPQRNDTKKGAPTVEPEQDQLQQDISETNTGPPEPPPAISSQMQAVPPANQQDINRRNTGPRLQKKTKKGAPPVVAEHEPLQQTGRRKSKGKATQGGLNRGQEMKAPPAIAAAQTPAPTLAPEQGETSAQGSRRVGKRASKAPTRLNL